MKKFYSLLITCCFILSFPLILIGQEESKRELRAAWIATYSNIDWPDRKATPKQQRADFIKIIEHHKQTGINAVYVQVRSQSDAMYPSSLEPWSADLTGVQGMAPVPFWDPLEFMISECRKRGIEFHAWLNPYRAAGRNTLISSFSKDHITKKQPGWLLRSGTKVTLNPGLPHVRNHILSVITDILTRYDVDGIHFDDYFYPEFGFNDDVAYNADPRGIISRADWRRDNVNLLIQSVSSTINQLKPWVKFGVSPSGIYRNSTDFNIGSTTKGMEHYSVLYADSKKWLQEGWIDYIEPQVYWYQGQVAADYNTLIPWWNNNSFGRHVYIGIAGYKVESWGNSPWSNSRQIPNQLRLNRSFINQNIKGTAFYNTSSMNLNLLGFRDSLMNDFYRIPALLPTMPWKDSIAPAAPFDLRAINYKDSIQLSWSSIIDKVNELNKIKQFVIYRSLEPSININDPANILKIINNQLTYTDKQIQSDLTYYYFVTALDRLHNESNASNLVQVGKTSLPITLNSFYVKPANDKEIQLSWSTLQETGLKEFQIQYSVDGNQFITVRKIPAKGTSENQKYAFIEKAIVFNKPVYYRLSLLDSAGTESFSRTISQVISKEVPIVRLNTRILPGNDIQLGIISTGKIAYAIYNLERKKVTWGKIRELPVNSQVIIPGTKDLLPGEYVINIRSGEIQQNIRYIVSGLVVPEAEELK